MTKLWMVFNNFGEPCESYFDDEERAETYAKKAAEDSPGDVYSVAAFVLQGRPKPFCVEDSDDSDDVLEGDDGFGEP